VSSVYTITESALKPDAPDDAVETLSKNLIAPLLEKLVADGTLHEYEVDTQEVHTEAPGAFLIVYLAANAGGLDKVNAALREAIKSNPLAGPAFDSMVDITAHRDDLVRASATYK
jgi:2-hydroxy-3-keto-5-methylthiopentenyl-1-phosphate phosphatase